MAFAFQKYKMNFNKETGVIEMIMESLLQEDEGTFTFQLQDGKATNQSSLVLIGDGRINSATHSLLLLSSSVTLSSRLCQSV